MAKRHVPSKPGPGEQRFRKEYKALARTMDEAGWVMKTTSRGHVLFIDATGMPRASFGGSSSDWRAIKNLMSQLRRGGLVFDKDRIR